MFLSRLLQFALFLVLMRVVLRFIAAFMAGLRGEPAAAKSGPTPLAMDLVRDRVCNTFLPRERALSARVGGVEQHFCSAACRDKALALSRAS
jgi:hypothetical protein